MGKVLKTAVIGCGKLGRREAAIVAELEGVELTAVCDLNLTSARAVAEQYEGCRAYDSYQELLEQEELTCVLVVTPTYTHKDICVAAARAHCHIFCEKPMALRLSECDVMLQAAEDNGVKLMIGFVRRFQPAFREMKRRLEAGDLGEVKMLYAIRMGGRPEPGVEGWRRQRSKVGGLLEGFVHEIDLLRWYGGRVRNVRGVMNFGTFPDTDVEDNIFITLEFENDAVGALQSSQIFPLGAYDFGLAGTRGAMRYGGNVNTLVFCRQGDKPERITLEPRDALRDELQHFFDCVRHDRQPDIPGTHGKQALEITLAAYRSAEDGKIVRLPIG